MIRKLLSAALFSLFILNVSPPASAQKLNLNETIPVDTSVTKGVLPNGLTYYIRTNHKPKDKVELRLVVNAGSILENDNQQGLAHFMEHMEFNGLKHFPKNDLVHYLQSIGVQFGADLNANTGWDRTYYILPIPIDNPKNLTKGFEIVSDWAGGALLSTDEINDERHVIAEELRMRDKNAGTRMMKKFLPEMLNGSRYAYRLPGGKDSIVLHGSPDRVREFYHDWYRPNLMAVIVVGDISKAKAKSMIEKYFSPLKNPKNERERKYYSVKPYTKSRAMIVTDSEATNYSFDLLFPAEDRHIDKTLQDYRYSLVKSIFTRTLNRKLHDMAQTAKPPYTSASAHLSGTFGGITLWQEGFELDVSPVDNFKTSIDSAFVELLRVKKYGFSEKDIENTKKEILADYEQAYNERDKTLSSNLVGEYTRNFMRKESIPGIVNEYHYVQEMLPTISAKEVSDLASNVLSKSQNFFALITGPAKGDIKLPSEAELQKMVGDAFGQTVSKSAETASATSLLSQEPTAGKIVSSTKDAQLGTTTYTLSNGVLVTVKPTDFKSDEIVLTGVKYGGDGLFDAGDKANAHFLTTIIGTMGYGQFTPSALKDFLSGKTVSLSTDMGASSNAVDGSSSVKDFPTLLQLNYLKLTEPRMDKDLFQGFKTKLQTQLKFIKANPQAAFVDTLIKVMYNNSPLAPIAVPSENDINSINADRCIEIYKNQFGNADGFHFFIVGNVDEGRVKELIEKYIASLPVQHLKPHYRDNGLRPVKGEKVFKFYKGSDQKSLILTQFHGDNIKYSDGLALNADLLGQMMTMEILDTIREKMAAIYSGGAYAGVNRVPYPHYTVMAQMPCGPENVDKILTELNKEVKGFKANGGLATYLDKAKKQTMEKHKENVKKNSYWASQLQDIMVWGGDKDFFLNYDKELNNINQKDIEKTANMLLGGNEFTAISFPETKEDNKDKK